MNAEELARLREQLEKDRYYAYTPGHRETAEKWLTLLDEVDRLTEALDGYRVKPPKTGRDCTSLEVSLLARAERAEADLVDEKRRYAEGLVDAWDRAHHVLCSVTDYSDRVCHVNPYRVMLSDTTTRDLTEMTSIYLPKNEISDHFYPKEREQ